MKKLVSFFAVMILLTPGNLSAACTDAEVRAKGAEFQGRIKELSEKDPQRVIALSGEIQTRLEELQNLATLDLICKFYDEMLERMK